MASATTVATVSEGTATMATASGQATASATVGEVTSVKVNTPQQQGGRP